VLLVEGMCIRCGIAGLKGEGFIKRFICVRNVTNYMEIVHKSIIIGHLPKSMKSNNEKLDVTLLKWRGYMEELELPFYINQSCALGIYRNGSLFPNERVVEFGVLAEDLTENKYHALTTGSKYDFHRENPHMAPMGLLYFHDLELQPVFFKGDKAFYNLTESIGIWFPQEYLKKENWGKIKYLDMDWNVPGNIEKYFECTYGDWRIPKSFIWANDALNKITWEQL
jgi:hypothetical protein